HPRNGVQEARAATQKGHYGRLVRVAVLDQGHYPLEGKIPLRAFQNPSVRHDSGVAHRAREHSDFQHAFLPDHIPHIRRRAVSGDRNSGLAIPGGIPDRVGDTLAGERTVGVIQSRRIENDLTRPDPVIFCPYALVVEGNGWLPLLEPFEIPGRLPSRRVYGVAFVYRARGDLVVEVRPYVHGRVL